MRSHLLEGTVRHRRARPFEYAFEHDVYYVALDLAELDEVTASLRLVARNRPAVVEFRDADHLVPPATDVRLAIDDHLRGEGLEPEGWRITLITNLRTLGHVFNPASFYLCRDPAGVLQVVIVEVHNTHLERHLYTLRPGGDGPDFVTGMDKDFYVSPFIELAGRYAVLVRDESARLRITINQLDDGGLLLHTSLDLERRRLTDRTLGRRLLRHPLMTQRTLAFIHWHALRLWWRGARFHRHGEVPG
jgi:DUF1365 family protein